MLNSSVTRLLTASTAFVAAGLLLAACSAQPGTASQGSSKASGSSNSDTMLNQIEKSGQLKVGLCTGSPGWGNLNPSGQHEGFDTDVAQQLAKYLKVKLVPVTVNNASRIPALQSGNAQVISCSFTVNAERAKQVAFSTPVVYSGNSMLVQKGSDLHSLSQLDGKKVGVNSGGTSVQIVTQFAPKAQQIVLTTISDDVTALKNQQVDAVIDTSQVVKKSALADPSQLKVAIDGKVGPRVTFALGVGKGHPALLAKVNAFLKQFHAKDEGTKLYKHWFWNPSFEFNGLEK